MVFPCFSKEQLKDYGASFTASEIGQQPELWQEIFNIYKKEHYNLDSFLNTALNEVDEVVLTGAGTSAFIGLSLKNTFISDRKKCTSVTPTTEIITHPQSHFNFKSSILLVSFARSGNSPESLGVVQFADRLCKKVYHLIISCSKEGDLANYESKNPKFTFLLPPRSNDKSLAMTSSYTGMLLAGLLIAEKRTLHHKEKMVNRLIEYGENILNTQNDTLFDLAKKNIERAVFLGSGGYYGVAKESHLKLQEMTDGQLICKYDSFLGFRHGPKAVVDEKTLMVYLISSDNYISQYEKDLIHAMDKGKNPLAELFVSEFNPENKYKGQILVANKNNTESIGPYFYVCAVLPAQILSFYKSINLDLSPDSPSRSGAISRVVEGVQIYPNFN